MNADEARRLAEQSTRAAQEDSLRRHLEEKERRLQEYKGKAREVIRQLPALLEDGAAAAARSGKRELLDRQGIHRERTHLQGCQERGGLEQSV